MKGATNSVISCLCEHAYFNPRTREGCDISACVGGGTIRLISIHAPVKGATFHPHQNFDFSDISIHAPVKGATCVVHAKCIHDFIISIHAPVKGATQQAMLDAIRITVFQSTHP